MEIQQIKKIISDTREQHIRKIEGIRKNERYYRNKNKILAQGAKKKDRSLDDEHPLKNADNRISHSWHRLLLDQKTAYTMTTPPQFDVGNDRMNEEIVKLLGSRYAKVAKELCVNAGNAGIAWLHVWKDEKKGFFKYAPVDSKQIIPVFSKSLDHELLGVLRIYEDFDDQGETIVIYEYWNDKECSYYFREKRNKLEDLEEFNVITLYDIGTGEAVGATNIFKHDWGMVPFIPFRNNSEESTDLEPIQKLIDVYDKVFSGFVNDIDDIQEIIFVLTNYGGQDKREFLEDLKNYKMVKVEDDGEGAKGRVETLAVDIPLDARKELLNLTRESIFTHGQGVDPQKNIGQNNSGAALKYMYSLLELKASLLETEFRIGFGELARFILKYFNVDPDTTIKQVWTRTAISNDLEQAEIVAKMAVNTSVINIAKANPIVDDWQQEVKYLKSEKEADYRATDDYRDFGHDHDQEDEE